MSWGYNCKNNFNYILLRVYCYGPINSLLFTLCYQTKNHFIWKLKCNLHVYLIDYFHYHSLTHFAKFALSFKGAPIWKIWSLKNKCALFKNRNLIHIQIAIYKTNCLFSCLYIESLIVFAFCERFFYTYSFIRKI